MIIDRPLNEAEASKAQRQFLVAQCFAAVARVCTGSTVLILCALRLGLSNSFSSAFGAFIYISYMFLPMGFVFAGRWGVGRSILYQRIFGLFVCLLLGGCVIAPHGAKALFIFGVILFYLHESGAVAMSFPLQKCITTERTLPVLQARCSIAGYTLSFLTSLTIAWYVARFNEMFAVPSLFLLGGVLFILSGLVMSRMDEPSSLMEHAATPMLPELREALAIPLMRKELAAGFVLNLSLTMLPSACVLAAKNGCGLDDSHVLVLTAFQILAVVAASRFYQTMTQRFGARMMIFGTYPLIPLLCAIWILMPVKASWWFLAGPFMVCGIMGVLFSTAMGNYFIVSMPERLQVPGTFLLFVVTGGFPGILGMLLNPLLFHLARRFSGEGPMDAFRLYHAVCAVLFMACLPVVLWLPRRYKGVVE